MSRRRCANVASEATLSRESKLIATASALQPKSLDLTQFARARVADNTRRMRVGSDEASAALAFATVDVIDKDGGTRKGDELPGMLLRLKYANQWGKALFQRAHLILLKRHGWDGKRDISETLFAIAYAAIVEWVQDRCPKCRGARQGQRDPLVCLSCGLHKEMVDTVVNGRLTKRAVITGRPALGCPKCHGLGRIFEKDKKRGKGMRCVPCGNSGRRSFPVKQRWFLVVDFLQSSAAARGLAYDPLKIEVFRTNWMPKYHKFLDILQDIDRNQITSGIDFSFAAAPSTVADPEELEFLKGEA